MLQSQSHATYLNLILYFEHKSELESENKPAILQFVSAFTEFVPIMHVQRSEIIFFYFACLVVKINLKSFQTGKLLFLKMSERTQTTGMDN